MNVSLEGLSLHIADLEQSIAFYSRIPGAEMVMHRPGQFARFQIGTGSLHLVQLPSAARFHIELDVENLSGAHEQLRAAGLSPKKPQHPPWGKTDFRLTDPDGNILEFGCYEGAG